MKVKVDKNLCIGCGSCVAIAENTFEFGEDGLAQPKEQEIVPKKEPLKEQPKEEPKNFIININKIEFDLFKIFGIIKKEGIYKENNFIFELYKGY